MERFVFGHPGPGSAAVVTASSRTDAQQIAAPLADTIKGVPSKIRSPWTDVLVLGIAFASIAAYCYLVSIHRILWSDELFGWMLITDPSLQHMLAAWRGGCDGGGLVFYLTGRLWLRVLGRTVLSFRMFSAAGCFLGLTALWFAMRRFYRPLVAALSLFLVWFGSETILWQMIQTRFYGMLLGASALAFLAATARDGTSHRSKRAWQFIFVLLANLLLVGTHPFGILYSAVILAGAAGADLLMRRPRAWLYLGSVLSWPFLLTAREAMANSAKVGRPRFWTVRPTMLDLERWYSPHGLPGLGLLLFLFAVAFLCSRRLRSHITPHSRSRVPILLPALLLALAPCLIWLISQHGTAFFVDRYMIPFTIGIAVLISEGATLLLPETGAFAFRRQRAVVALLALFLIADTARTALWRYPRDIVVPPLDFTPELASKLPRNIPVVIERVDTFDMMLAQQRAPDLPLVYLLDWPVAIAPDSPRGLAAGYHEMENWKRFGYFSGSIFYADDFLRSATRFVVFRDPDIRWLDHRILHDPEWQATRIADFSGHPNWAGTIWIVQRR